MPDTDLLDQIDAILGEQPEPKPDPLLSEIDAVLESAPPAADLSGATAANREVGIRISQALRISPEQAEGLVAFTEGSEIAQIRDFSQGLVDLSNEDRLPAERRERLTLRYFEAIASRNPALFNELTKDPAALSAARSLARVYALAVHATPTPAERLDALRELHKRLPSNMDFDTFVAAVHNPETNKDLGVVASLIPAEVARLRLSRIFRKEIPPRATIRPFNRDEPYIPPGFDLRDLIDRERFSAVYTLASQEQRVQEAQQLADFANAAPSTLHLAASGSPFRPLYINDFLTRFTGALGTAISYTPLALLSYTARGIDEVGDATGARDVFLSTVHSLAAAATTGLSTDTQTTSELFDTISRAFPQLTAEQRAEVSKRLFGVRHAVKDALQWWQTRDAPLGPIARFLVPPGVDAFSAQAIDAAANDFGGTVLGAFFGSWRAASYARAHGVTPSGFARALRTARIRNPSDPKIYHVFQALGTVARDALPEALFGRQRSRLLDLADPSPFSRRSRPSLGKHRPPVPDPKDDPLFAAGISDIEHAGDLTKRAIQDTLSNLNTVEARQEMLHRLRTLLDRDAPFLDETTVSLIQHTADRLDSTIDALSTSATALPEDLASIREALTNLGLQLNPLDRAFVFRGDPLAAGVGTEEIVRRTERFVETARDLAEDPVAFAEAGKRPVVSRVLTARSRAYLDLVEAAFADASTAAAVRRRALELRGAIDQLLDVHRRMVDNYEQSALNYEARARRAAELYRSTLDATVEKALQNAERGIPAAIPNPLTKQPGMAAAERILAAGRETVFADASLLRRKTLRGAPRILQRVFGPGLSPRLDVFRALVRDDPQALAELKSLTDELDDLRKADPKREPLADQIVQRIVDDTIDLYVRAANKYLNDAAFPHFGPVPKPELAAKVRNLRDRLSKTSDPLPDLTRQERNLLNKLTGSSLPTARQAARAINYIARAADLRRKQHSKLLDTIKDAEDSIKVLDEHIKTPGTGITLPLSIVRGLAAMLDDAQFRALGLDASRRRVRGLSVPGLQTRLERFSKQLSTLSRDLGRELDIHRRLHGPLLGIEFARLPPAIAAHELRQHLDMINGMEGFAAMRAHAVERTLERLRPVERVELFNALKRGEFPKDPRLAFAARAINSLRRDLLLYLRRSGVISEDDFARYVSTGYMHVRYITDDPPAMRALAREFDKTNVLLPKHVRALRVDPATLKFRIPEDSYWVAYRVKDVDDLLHAKGFKSAEEAADWIASKPEITEAKVGVPRPEWVKDVLGQVRDPSTFTGFAVRDIIEAVTNAKIQDSFVQTGFARRIEEVKTSPDFEPHPTRRGTYIHRPTGDLYYTVVSKYMPALRNRVVSGFAINAAHNYVEGFHRYSRLTRDMMVELANVLPRGSPFFSFAEKVLTNFVRGVVGGIERVPGVRETVRPFATAFGTVFSLAKVVFSPFTWAKAWLSNTFMFARAAGVETLNPIVFARFAKSATVDASRALLRFLQSGGRAVDPILRVLLEGNHIRLAGGEVIRDIISDVENRWARDAGTLEQRLVILKDAEQKALAAGNRNVAAAARTQISQLERKLALTAESQLSKFSARLFGRYLDASTRALARLTKRGRALLREIVKEQAATPNLSSIWDIYTIVSGDFGSKYAILKELIQNQGLSTAEASALLQAFGQNIHRIARVTRGTLSSVAGTVFGGFAADAQRLGVNLVRFRGGWLAANMAGFLGWNIMALATHGIVPDQLIDYEAIQSGLSSDDPFKRAIILARALTSRLFIPNFPGAFDEAAPSAPYYFDLGPTFYVWGTLLPPTANQRRIAQDFGGSHPLTRLFSDATVAQGLRFLFSSPLANFFKDISRGYDEFNEPISNVPQFFDYMLRTFGPQVPFGFHSEQVYKSFAGTNVDPITRRPKSIARSLLAGVGLRSSFEPERVAQTVIGRQYSIEHPTARLQDLLSRDEDIDQQLIAAGAIDPTTGEVDPEIADKIIRDYYGSYGPQLRALAREVPRDVDPARFGDRLTDISLPPPERLFRRLSVEGKVAALAALVEILPSSGRTEDLLTNLRTLLLTSIERAPTLDIKTQNLLDLLGELEQQGYPKGAQTVREWLGLIITEASRESR